MHIIGTLIGLWLAAGIAIWMINDFFDGYAGARRACRTIFLWPVDLFKAVREYRKL